MPGGGPFSLASGQITDDSELAMMLMHGLIDKSIPPYTVQEGKNRENYLVLDNIAYYYKQWMVSPPFDIGYTTRNALSAATQGVKPTWKRISAKAASQN